MGLSTTIKNNNDSSTQDRAKAMIFLRHHLHQALKTEYLTIKDPYVLWSSLYERYGHLKSVILPNARNEWNALRLQDFKLVHEYNFALYIITSQLKLRVENITDEDMLEKNIYNISCFQATTI